MKLLTLIIPQIITAALILISCSGGDVDHKRLFFRMNTMAEITIVTPRSFDPKPLWKVVDSLLLSSEERFSVTGDDSEVKILNERTSQSIPISYELGEMLQTGLAWGDSLGGAFDITVLPLKEIWGFCEQCGDGEPLPDSSSIIKTADMVDYKKVRVSAVADSVFFDSPDIKIDVGGIAKGFILWKLGELLKNHGVENYLIAIGGDIIASGQKRSGEPWRVGIRHPRDHSEIILTIPLINGTVVTSGDYERFRVVDNVRYHHIFDPLSGYPCAQNQSVTIVSDDPVIADILSTGLFCRNADDILAYVRERGGIECVIVDAEGNVLTSSEF